jgi:ABC-type glycerol-3-phosphate transport system substrate-binding protein
VRFVLVLVVALALLAAGCGGGSNESAATTETTTAADTTTTETTTTSETTSGETTDTTDLSSVLGNKDCLALASVGATMAKAFAGTNGVSGDTAELDALASKVPEEIRADVETLAQAFSQYASKLKDIGITPGTTPSADQLQQLQSALTSLDQQKLTEASARIEAWSKKNCTG